MIKLMRTALASTRALLAAAAIVASIATVATPASAMNRSADLRVNGTIRTYSVHVPNGPRPIGGFPVILVFHGGGMQGAAMKRLTHFDAVADERGFIPVYPDGLGKHWNDGRSTIRNPQDDIGFVAALLDRVERDYAVDRSRVFATGISNGALFAERVGCELSQRIAGIAPVAGTMPTEMAPRCRPVRPVAVMQIDGLADPIMPYRGGAVADFGGKGEGGQVLSVADTVALWARFDGCGPRTAPQPLPPRALFDRTRIVRGSHDACSAGGAVTVLTVIGGGHAWPGGMQYAPPRMIGIVSRQIDASRVIAGFFLSLPQRV